MLDFLYKPSNDEGFLAFMVVVAVVALVAMCVVIYLDARWQDKRNDEKEKS